MPPVMPRTRQVGFAVSFSLALILLLLAAPSPASPKGNSPAEETSSLQIQYSKKLSEGDLQEYHVTLDTLGRGSYEAKPRSGDVVSLEFTASAETVRQILSAFEAIDFLDSNENYESPTRVAAMGMKTITLEKDGRSRTVEFNYTVNKPMARIDRLLDGLAATAFRLDSLQMKMKYDKLGLPAELGALETELKNHWLTDPQILIPTLSQIAANSSYFNMVQRKAEELKWRIEAAKAETK